MRQILPSLVGWVEGIGRLLGELVHRNSVGAGAHEIDLGAFEAVLDVLVGSVGGEVQRGAEVDLDGAEFLFMGGSAVDADVSQSNIKDCCSL